jgi:hypothetical protein
LYIHIREKMQILRHVRFFVVLYVLFLITEVNYFGYISF